MEGKYKLVEQHFNLGLALIGISGTRPSILGDKKPAQVMQYWS